MKRLFIAVCALMCALGLHAQEIDSTEFYIAQFEEHLNYQTGKIEFDSIGTVDVPEGFQFLDSAQASYILTTLWGNPSGECLGMLVPKGMSVMDSTSWVYVITYDPMGYVDDDDADDIDYDDLLKEMKTDLEEESKSRVEQGYSPIMLVAWASPPFYDEDKKTLHWAKELQFGDNPNHTLNYNVRILGRKGVMVMNAVATMNELPQVKQSIDKVQASFSFADGLRYKDFDPDVDEVAAWTIGGLVAGKLLAKAGILALVLKNIKLIFIGLAALGAGFFKWFKKKKEENPYARKDSGQQAPPA